VFLHRERTKRERERKQRTLAFCTFVPSEEEEDDDASFFVSSSIFISFISERVLVLRVVFLLFLLFTKDV